MGYSKEHKNPSGGLNERGRAFFKKTEGSNLKAPVSKGKNPRRISFEARFAGMKGPLEKNGKPTRLKLALKKWGFANKQAAASFAANNKASA